MLGRSRSPPSLPAPREAANLVSEAAVPLQVQAGPPLAFISKLGRHHETTARHRATAPARNWPFPRSPLTDHRQGQRKLIGRRHRRHRHRGDGQRMGHTHHLCHLRLLAYHDHSAALSLSLSLCFIIKENL